MARRGRRYGCLRGRTSAILRVVQAGLGIWGQSWADVVREAPNVELAALADPAPKTREVAGTPVYESVEAALAEVACDAVLVATPPGTHHAVAKASLEAGRHVLVEKPLATDLAGAFDLIEVAEEAGRFLMVSQNYRYNGPFRALRRAVGEGGIGDLVSIKISCRRDTRTLFGTDDFRYSMRHPYVLDMSIHHFDLIRAATGREVARVHARGRRVPDSPFAHHPAVSALLDLEGGVPVLYEGDWATREPETSWNGDWEVVGEEGRLLWRGDRDDRGVGEVLLERWGEAPRALATPEPEFTERAATLQALRAAVETGEVPETSAADNVRSLAVTLGCVRSVEKSETVDIEQMIVGARREARPAGR
ncbi:Gfo/Idh/MocA family protein [Rubrobacter tropicus]|uniref:Gfo/Idh/MocA family protein n=1 Tax=Rubrobacter tropicus TaxID=2653851 RepID=UPI00140754FA|nr:Gfo/Idh/MocA family oxidoreductase [Rubrobacter tropicus]